MLHDTLTGARYLLRGFRLIQQPGIRRYIVIPLLINTLLLLLLIWYGASKFEQLIEWLLPDWLEWLHWLLWPAFAVAILLICLSAFVLLANIIGSPFNGLLANAVERHLEGRHAVSGDDGRRWLASLWLILRAELRKLSIL